VYEKSYDVFCKKVIETKVIGNKQIRYIWKICWRNLLSLLRTLRMWTHLNTELLNSSNNDYGLLFVLDGDNTGFDGIFEVIFQIRLWGLD
jgi:hypothetical protein